MAKSGINPQFLKVEKRIPYTVRLPKRLIDKLNSYAELSGKTTTNIINSVLDDFIADKVVLNDYLDNVGGVTVKIPYAIYQKNRFKDSDMELTEYNNNKSIRFYYADTFDEDTYFAELFEIKKISNNLDIYSGDSYVANKSILKNNTDAIHSGIELFIYNITESIFADAIIGGKFDSDDSFASFVNCLYCLYYEVAETGETDVYLVDYLTAINLLSISGNDDYKDLIIAAATELKDIDNVVSTYYDDYAKGELDIAENYLSDSTDETYSKYEKEVEKLHNKLFAECNAKCNELVEVIADGYNSNNIIKFGSDIFSRLAVKEIDVAPDIDEIIDEKIDEKINAVFDDKISEIKKVAADISAEIDKMD